MKSTEIYEISVIGTIIDTPVLSIPFLELLGDYKWNANYRTKFIKKLKVLKEKDKISRASVLTIIHSEDNEFRDILMSCLGYADTINFKSHIERLLLGVQYDKLATGYMEYLKKINNEEPIESIISDNVQLITDMDIVSNDTFHVTQHALADKMMMAIQEESYGERVYLTGDEKLDVFLQMAKRNIILIGGKSGALKTKFSMKIINGLVENNKNIAVLHYAMEDSAEQLMRGYAAMKISLLDEEMSGRGYKMNTEENERFLNQIKFNSKYDIEYVNKASYIKDIGAHFMKFKAKRPNKFCLLVIDNFMKIQDQFNFSNSVKADDYITGIIDSWNIKTSSEEVAIMLLHHFVDVQISRDNKHDGYRPKEGDFRGSTRIRDMSTKIILTNFIGNYHDIHDKFSIYPKSIKRLYVVEIPKNRLGKTGTIRYVAFPEFNQFFNIDEIL